MKTQKEIRFNNVSNSTNLSNETATLNRNFADLQNCRIQIRCHKDMVRKASESLINAQHARITEKFNAKAPYIVRKDGLHRNGQRRHVDLVKCDKVLAITERGVIFRVHYQITGKDRYFRGAIELSHEQMQMSDADWQVYLNGYSAFITATYPYTRRESSVDAATEHFAQALAAVLGIQ